MSPRGCQQSVSGHQGCAAVQPGQRPATRPHRAAGQSAALPTRNAPQAASHADGRGAIYRFKLHGETTVNMYFTNAGHMRSGDLHDCNQYDVRGGGALTGRGAPAFACGI